MYGLLSVFWLNGGEFTFGRDILTPWEKKDRKAGKKQNE
jgi:hypothetical protein